MAEEVQITEASVREFETQLKLQEVKLKEAETKYLKRLVQEAKDAGVDSKEEELLSIGEKGIVMLTEQAKAMKSKLAEVSQKVEVKEMKGIVTTESSDYEPIFALGPIKVVGNEMYREWKPNYFRELYTRMVTGKTMLEDFY
jgi:uncharacterized protein (DUF342 family)